MNNDQSNGATSDYAIPDQIDDTISQIRWMPNQQTSILATAGWDAKIRVWSVLSNTSVMNQVPTTSFQSKLLCQSQFNDPLLSLCWNSDCTMIFTGCADGTVNYFDANSSQVGVIGKHEFGCKEIIWISQASLLMTGGWDGKLNIWDLRQQTPCMSIELGKRVYSMSQGGELLVLGLSDRIVTYFNLSKVFSGYTQPEATFESHLKYQTRKVCVFTENDGYAIGSIEGRVAVKFVDLKKNPEINNETKTMNNPNDFAFRCHRSADGQELYPVHDIAFNPVHGTFCTAGGDGSWIIWDKDSRSRLKHGFKDRRPPVVAVHYSPLGDILAYATGYDWSKGVAYEDPNIKPSLNLHFLPDAEKKKKQKK